MTTSIISSLITMQVQLPSVLITENGTFLRICLKNMLQYFQKYLNLNIILYILYSIVFHEITHANLFFLFQEKFSVYENRFITYSLFC